MYAIKTDMGSAFRLRPSAHGQRGTALLFAIVLLAVFSALGMAYVRYMELELDKSNLELREKRARQLSTAGVEIAAASLQQFVLNPEKRPIGFDEPYHIELPTYRGVTTGEEAIVAEEMGAPRLAGVNVTIVDESGKVNVNHAPASILQRVMGISGDAARTIAASVPRAGSAEGASWLLELDELSSRGLLKDTEFDPATASDLLTTYSVLDNDSPAGFLNINVAEPAVFEAVLDLSPEQASQVKAKGPFLTAAALAQAIAEVRTVPGEAVTVDSSVGFQSRCFRIICEGRYARFVDEANYRTANAVEKRKYLMNVSVNRVEAVLLFAPDGSYEVIQWNVDIDVAEDGGVVEVVVSDENASA